MGGPPSHSGQVHWARKNTKISVSACSSERERERVERDDRVGWR